MRRKERDLVAFFNALWYRDFPITPDRIGISKRALWTTHIASVVKQCGDLLGLYTCFETGNRTDAVIEDATGHKWAKVEWEWYQARNEQVNELHKLTSAHEEADVFVFVGYSRTDEPHHDENLSAIEAQWGSLAKPLIVFLVTFERQGDSRHFCELQTHLVQNGKRELLRRQPALPWEVKGTKWHTTKALA